MPVTTLLTAVLIFVAVAMNGRDRPPGSNGLRSASVREPC